MSTGEHGHNSFGWKMALCGSTEGPQGDKWCEK